MPDNPKLLGYIQLQAENKQLRTALEWLLNETMYRDHPEASQAAIDALKERAAGTGAGEG